MGGVGPPPAPRVKDLGGLLLELLLVIICRVGLSLHGALACTILSNAFSCFCAVACTSVCKLTIASINVALGRRGLHCVYAPSGECFCHGRRYSSCHRLCSVFFVLLGANLLAQGCETAPSCRWRSPKAVFGCCTNDGSPACTSTRQLPAHQGDDASSWRGFPSFSASTGSYAETGETGTRRRV